MSSATVDSALYITPSRQPVLIDVRVIFFGKNQILGSFPIQVAEGVRSDRTIRH
jgi:hypothetical protein